MSTETGTRPWYEEMMQGVEDPRLRYLILRALVALPWYEQLQTRVLGLRFEEGTLPEKARAQCKLHTNMAKDRGPMPVITLDPEKYREDDEERTVKTILHEIAHAVYRTPDISHAFSESQDTHDALVRIFETFCDTTAALWYQLDQQRRHEETAV